MPARIIGGKELRAALMKAPADLREEAGAEVRASTKRMHRKAMELFNSAASFAPFWHGQPGMQNITGAARRAYRYSVVNKGLTGRVGVLTGAAMGKVPELRWFLFGTSRQPARNVHASAFEDERDVFFVNQRKALQSVLRRMG